MTFEQQRQKKIEEAIKKKEKRYSKTELSILISWAINNAVNTLDDYYKSPSNWKLGQKLIKERYPWFIDLHREWMLDNLPIEPLQKLTKEDFFLAQKEAPQKQAEQEKIEELTEETRQQEETEELNAKLTTIEE